MAKIAFIGEPRSSQNMLPTFLLMQDAVNALGYSSAVISDFYATPEEIAAEYDLAICMRTLMLGKTAAVNRLKGWACDLKIGNAQYGQWLPQVSSPFKTIASYQTMDEIPADTPFYMKNILGVRFGPLGYRQFANVAEFKSTYSASRIAEILAGVGNGTNYLQALIPDGVTYHRATVMSAGFQAHMLSTYSSVGSAPLNPRAGIAYQDVAVTVPASDPSLLTTGLTMPFNGDMEWFDDGTAAGDKTLIEVNTRLPRIACFAATLLYGPDVFKNWLDCTVNRKVWNPVAVNQSFTLRATKDAAGAAAAGFTLFPRSDIIPAGVTSPRTPIWYKLP